MCAERPSRLTCHVSFEKVCTKNKVEHSQRYLLKMLHLSQDSPDSREPAPLETAMLRPAWMVGRR
jgi:hypothetical protein